MAAHLTEEEQIEAIKRWWKANGKFTVALILAVVVGWFAWNTWQERQQQAAEETSRQFSELMSTVTSGQSGTLTDEQRSTARTMAQAIVDEQPDSLYGNLSALLLARFDVDAGELDKAASRLREVKSNAANSSMGHLARLRLARVLAAQENYDQALAELSTNVDESFSAAFAEARGDIHFAQNQLADANAAYQQALDNLSPQQANRSGILQLKLDSSRTAGAGDSSDAAAQPAAEGDV